MPATNIDEVIQQLDRAIQTARARGSRLGYFPALYRKVTIKVREGLHQGWFENRDRMERLDVIFANRYLEALQQHEQGSQPTRAWQIAFEAAGVWWPVVLQHLLLGMNAHINLDLGIAAAQTAPGASLTTLRNDFNQINAVLASLLREVKDELSQVWPLLRLLDRIAGTADDVMINFSLARARDHAWELAERLAPLSPAEQQAAIVRADDWAAQFGHSIWRPAYPLGLFLPLIRIGERGSVARIIDILL